MKKKSPKDKQSVSMITRFTPSEAVLLRKACRMTGYAFGEKLEPSEMRRVILLDWALKVTAGTEK